MTTIRATALMRVGRETMEGAGVRLRRGFGSSGEATLFDPFLLFDDFSADDPRDFQRGFPWHPHRGIETVTYLVRGRVRHGDSIGNKGVIGPGDLQWMSAGGGIVHEEMPEAVDGGMMGFQLWVNLPRAHKMSPPRYRGITADTVPVVERPLGVRVRVLAGEVDGVKGPVADVAGAPMYLDVSVPLGGTFDLPIPVQRTAFAYVIDGSATFGEGPLAPVPAKHVALLGPGDALRAEAGAAGCRLLLMAGTPLKEPIAWRGPIVMNTQSELDDAFQQVRDGTFLKQPRCPPAALDDLAADPRPPAAKKLTNHPGSTRNLRADLHDWGAAATPPPAFYPPSWTTATPRRRVRLRVADAEKPIRVQGRERRDGL